VQADLRLTVGARTGKPVGQQSRSELLWTLMDLLPNWAELCVDSDDEDWDPEEGGGGEE
jgi:hypothetical protein